MILDIERRSPEEHDHVTFVMRNANRGEDFTRQDRTLPIKNLNLRSNEELLIQPAKKRPGIILSSEVDAFSDILDLLRKKGKKHLQEDSIFVIPCYGIENEFDRTGFPLEMVSRIRCLIYRQFFYFPDNNRFSEGIARFDRIRVIAGRDPSTIQPTDVCLSDAVLDLFLALFIFCITGVEDEDLSVTRSLLRGAYAPT